MRKTKLFLVLLLALLPFVGWGQRNYNGQHVSIKLATGDSIQYDLATDINGKGFKPVIKDGKVVWSFLSALNNKGNWSTGELFSINDIESIDFRSKEYDETEVRKALIEFYNAMNGDNWTHKDNWCSDKPISEWYGINSIDKFYYGHLPWVHALYLEENNLSGTIPNGCITRMGPVNWFSVWGNHISGPIPCDLGNLYSLTNIGLSGNKLTGVFPQELLKLPHAALGISDNDFEGAIPEEVAGFIESRQSTTWLNISNNHFTGKVPDAVKNSETFPYSWYYIVPQKKGLDLSDLDIPAPEFHTKYMDGTPLNSDEVYKNNQYTLLYKWGWWCPFSEGINEKLIPVYNAYKDKGFEIIGIHAGNGDNFNLHDYLEKHSILWKNLDYDEMLSHLGEMQSEGRVLDVALVDFIQNWLQSPTLLLVDQNGNVVFSTLMDENGRMPQDDRKWKVFDILEEKFGPVEYDLYTSTDYSHDGEVITLQQASMDEGIDLVFVGEGFTDKDIADGTFEQRMNEACNQFFLYEPYSSLRYRFNVYAVKAVSPNAEFYGNAKHAIDEDISKAFEYASKVPNLKPDRPMYVNVIYNKNSAGRSYCTMLEDNSYVCYAMDGVSNVLNHEAGGHGIGKLLDEYVEPGNENLTLPEGIKDYMEDVWTLFGWGANVDWRSDPKEVKWAKFIDDERYKDEQIGVFEGSYLYGHGAYRPTENSMMRENYLNSVLGFNAPSREAIYKRVMQESEGDDWTYDYEEFVTFDAAGHQQFVDALNNHWARRKAAPKVERQQLTAPPVFLKGTWQDALKKNNK